MINLHDILSAGNGQLFGDPAAEIFTDFCIDSRRVSQGELFVAAKTERGDGHQFMSEAVAGGALGIMCTHPPEFDTDGLTVVVMRDVEAALLNWAKLVIQKFGTTVIGITGSSGKSTSKEAVATVLGTRYRVYRSAGSYNGRLGLPLALGKLGAEHRLAVLEFGIDRLGEMADLVEATHPRVGVITNINHRFPGSLGTVENMAAENAVLLEQLPRDGLAVLNYDDDLVRELAARTGARVYTVGLDRTGSAYGADLTAYNLIAARDKTGFDLRYERERFRGHWVPLLGVHQLYSVLSALTVGLSFGISLEDGLHALRDMEPLPGRLQPLEGLNGSLLIDDTFNANPDSMLAALEFMKAIRVPGHAERFIFIVGDMDELGTQALRGHVEVGKKAVDTADLVITTGELGAVVGRTAVEQGMGREHVRITFNLQDAVALVRDGLGPDDVVLVKGGSAARMERVVQPLLAREDDSQRLPRQDSLAEALPSVRPSRPTWIEIDKNAIASNVRILKELVGTEVALMAVVKANAYGHGAVAVATTALLNGAAYLGVAAVSEAIELREAGIDAPILLLGYSPAWSAPQVLRYDLTITLYDLELARSFDRAAREMNSTLKVHIKIDSGMGRLGLLPDQVIPFFRSLRNLTNLTVEGVFTHFSSADDSPEFTYEQIRTFSEVLGPLRAGGFNLKYIHAANSAGAIGYPEARFDMVRVGIAMYGLSPGLPLPDGIRPALSWKTTIAQVKRLPPGSYVGYGNTYRTRDYERIAVIPVGYADGFRRSPKNWGYVLVRGQRAPLVGRVSMDQSMINVTQIPEVAIGDEVVLIGSQGTEQLTAETVAEQLGTNNYEVVSAILGRVPRV